MALWKILWELFEDFSDNFNSGHDGVDVSFLEIIESFNDFFLEGVSISKTLLDLGEVVFLNETVDESTDELFYIVYADLNLLIDAS